MKIAIVTVSILMMSVALASDFERGAEALRKMDYDLAITHFDAAIRTDPRHADAHWGRGTAFFYKGQHTKALENCSEAIRLDPKHGKAYYVRGYSHQSLGNFDKAIDDYDEAIRLGLQAFDIYNNRGNVHRMRKEYEAAIRDFTTAIKISPDRATVGYTARGYAKRGQKDYVGAIKDYEEAIRADPKFSPAYGNYADLLATCPKDAMRDGKKAILLATKACDLSEWKDPFHLSELAAAQAESGNFKDATRLQKNAIELWSNMNPHPDFLKFAREQLKLYEEGKPFRGE